MNNKNNITSWLRKSTPAGGVLGWLGIFIMIAAYSYLTYKLLTFDQYDELAAQWKNTPLSQFWWLAAVFLLLPINWLLEAVKWKKMTTNIQKINLSISMKAVLAGISTGFFTPNRVGELVGRVVFLEAEHRKAGVTLSLVNSLTQNLIMALCGIPAGLIFFYTTAGSLEADNSNFLLGIIGFLLVFGLFYFSLPILSKRLEESNIAKLIGVFTSCLSDFTITNLIIIMAISFARYLVFCTQFFLMLRFFSIHLDAWQALIAIPTNYLFVTFTPSVAFSEAAVRSSYSVIFIGVFSGQVVGIALAGVCIWAVNFVIPMLVGSVLMIRKR